MALVSVAISGSDEAADRNHPAQWANVPVLHEGAGSCKILWMSHDESIRCRRAINMPFWLSIGSSDIEVPGVKRGWHVEWVATAVLPQQIRVVYLAE